MQEPDYWIQSYTGKAINLPNPTLDTVDFRDISHALSLQCRYNGHCSRFYSVAEHCILMAQYFISQNQLGLAKEALFHDASEAYISDIPKPLKNMLVDYRRLEERFNLLIAERFSLEYPWHPEIKIADHRILSNEKQELFSNEPYPWKLSSLGPLPIRVVGMSPWVVEREFNNLFHIIDGA